MKSICLYFEIHQNIHLKRYRFFDIGTDHYYYDDYENERSITETAENSYIPALRALIEMAERYGSYFKCAFSLSGTAIELLEQYSPEVLELLDQLNRTGCVEFLAEPYSHGFSSIKSPECFKDEVRRLSRKIKSLFGVEPRVLRNSCLMYSDEIGALVAEMGFKGMLAEGAKQTLGWKSPHYLYHCALDGLSEDISYRFNDRSWNEYPLYAETYARWIAEQPADQPVVCLFMELCALGMFQPLSSNILDFFKALPEQLRNHGITFATPSELCDSLESVGPLPVEYPTTWVDEERDLSPWLGNIMQQEALDKLYSVADRVRIGGDKRLRQDWDYLQASNNLRFISTKANSYGGYRGIYASPYDAFTNYMNILGDFITRVNDLYPLEIDNDELNALLTTIKNQGDELAVKDKEIDKLKNLIGRLEKEALAREEAAGAPATSTEKSVAAAEKTTSAAEAPTTTSAKAVAAPKKATPAAPHSKKKGGKRGGKG